MSLKESVGGARWSWYKQASCGWRRRWQGSLGCQRASQAAHGPLWPEANVVSAASGYPGTLYTTMQWHGGSLHARSSSTSSVHRHAGGIISQVEAGTLEELAPQHQPAWLFAVMASPGSPPRAVLMSATNWPMAFSWASCPCNSLGCPSLLRLNTLLYMSATATCPCKGLQAMRSRHIGTERLRAGDVQIILVGYGPPYVPDPTTQPQRLSIPSPHPPLVPLPDQLCCLCCIHHRLQGLCSLQRHVARSLHT